MDQRRLSEQLATYRRPAAFFIAQAKRGKNFSILSAYAMTHSLPLREAMIP
jgi:hypothetical protein